MCKQMLCLLAVLVSCVLDKLSALLFLLAGSRWERLNTATAQQTQGTSYTHATFPDHQWSPVMTAAAHPKNFCARDLLTCQNSAPKPPAGPAS